MRRLLKRGDDVYVYFNNDAEGHAVANARTLTEMMRRRPSGDAMSC